MDELTLNDMEISAIGEVSNISLGNAATALGILLRDDIDISVPNVLIKNKGELMYESDFTQHPMSTFLMRQHEKTW
jgi:flagellar motor switch protein FliN/FliY